MTPEQTAAIERLRDKMLDNTVFWDELFKDALPLLEALAAENERLRARIDGALEVLNISLPEDCDSDVWMASLEESNEKAIEILKGEPAHD